MGGNSPEHHLESDLGQVSHFYGRKLRKKITFCSNYLRMTKRMDVGTAGSVITSALLSGGLCDSPEHPV